MRPTARRRSAALAFATLGVWLAGEGVAHARQAESVRPQEQGWRFVMDERPSVRFGDVLRVDVTGLLDFEWRGENNTDDDAEFGRKRLGFDGRLFRVLAFEVERDLGDEHDPWRDALVEFRKYRAFRVRGGHFKIPFGAERLRSIRDIEFVRRSTVTETLAPGRDTGLQLSGRLFGNVLTYMTGVFHHDGSTRPRENEVWSGKSTAAARLVVSPLVKSGVRMLRDLEAGVGYTHGDVREGLYGPALRLTDGFEAFSPMYVSGTRQRLGVDTNLVRGAFAFRGEYLRQWDDRHGQGLAGDDLPDLVADGWQISGTWIAIGDLKDGGRRPRAPLFGGGAGAIQLAGRVESLGFHSDGSWDDAFRNPRAANVLGNDFQAWTLGVNWYPVRYLKLQFNVIRERLDDAERRPDATRPWSTSRLFRVQFSI